MNITETELEAEGFQRSGTVLPDGVSVLRVEIDSDVSGPVLYLMRVNGEVKKCGITGTGVSGFRQRMNSTFSALRNVIQGLKPGRVAAKWRSRRLDPFKEHAAATIVAGQTIELWTLRCPSVEWMMAKEAELNQKFRPRWTKEGRLSPPRQPRQN